jgi:hypothetical protein
METLESVGIYCGIYPFAQPLKEICFDVFGLSNGQCWGTNEEKNTPTSIRWRDLPLCGRKIAMLLEKKHGVKSSDFMTGREFMQILGTDVFRSIDQDCWAKATIKRISEENPDFAIISDARFPNEIEFVAKYNPITIRLNRSVIENSHCSETALDNYDFSAIKDYYEIDNRNMSIGETNEAIMDIIKKYI